MVDRYKPSKERQCCAVHSWLSNHLEDDAIIGWSVMGYPLKFRNVAKFRTDVLQSTHHSKLTSFQRQLNYFSFKRLLSVNQRIVATRVYFVIGTSTFILRSNDGARALSSNESAARNVLYVSSKPDAPKMIRYCWKPWASLPTTL
jgi:hypothetical protein